MKINSLKKLGKVRK